MYAFVPRLTVRVCFSILFKTRVINWLAFHCNHFLDRLVAGEEHDYIWLVTLRKLSFSCVYRMLAARTKSIYIPSVSFSRNQHSHMPGPLLIAGNEMILSKSINLYFFFCFSKNVYERNYVYKVLVCLTRDDDDDDDD